MTEKALFIPLTAKFYDAFIRGDKDTEYRLCGKRWNEKTCFLGRQVVLSRGYGKKNRAKGTITSIEICPYWTLPGLLKISLRSLYKNISDDTWFICIGIELAKSTGDLSKDENKS